MAADAWTTPRHPWDFYCLLNKCLLKIREKSDNDLHKQKTSFYLVLRIIILPRRWHDMLRILSFVQKNWTRRISRWDENSIRFPKFYVNNRPVSTMIIINGEMQSMWRERKSEDVNHKWRISFLSPLQDSHEWQKDLNMGLGWLFGFVRKWSLCGDDFSKGDGRQSPWL